MNTTIADALEAAGRDTAQDQLYVAAQECLGRTDREPNRAINAFERRVGQSPVLLRALALDYLRRVAEDMRTPPGESQTGRVHYAGPAQSWRHTNGAGEGQHEDEAQIGDAPTRATERDGEQGEELDDTQVGVAPPSHHHPRADVGQNRSDAQVNGARPARGPSPADREAMKSARRLGIQDTFKITERQGTRTPVGDIRAHAWASIAARKSKAAWIDGREAEFAAILAQLVEKQAHVPQDAKTRDILSDEMIEAAIAESAKIADYQRRITSVVQEIVHG